MCVMSGMQAETEVLCRQKEAAAANRKDSKLKAVVISEAWDKKSCKYNSPSVPFPFDSKVTYEQSMRTPMGREFNTTAAHRQDTVFVTAQPRS
jgi:U3 small nucleolar RNA-associated protein 14